MSETTMNTPRSTGQTSGEAYDTGLYDPNRHDNQIVALYNTRADAEAARDKLVAAGVDSGSVQVMDREDDKMAGGVDYEAGDQGLWGAIKSLFVPDDEAHAYRHAVGTGHAMVVVTPGTSTDRRRVIEVLESTDPIDFDAKLEEWRQSGYDSTAARSTTSDTASAATAPAATAAAGMTQTASASGTAAAAAGTATPAAGTAGTDTIKRMEERLRVGKREVAQGAVRVRSYVVERPVEEQVRLHEERISVERNPVDRPATAADASAFQERVIEASATSEEALVSKEARVVEEIGIRKDATERTETIRDTVRHTKVDIEDDSKRMAGTTGSAATGSTSVTGGSSDSTPGKGAGSSVPGGTGASSTGTMGTGGTTPNSTPGATTSGMNAPRK